MNTEYVALPESATVAEAIEGLKAHEEILETLIRCFWWIPTRRLTAAVPLAKLFVAAGATPLKDLASEPLLQVDVEEKQDRITEISTSTICWLCRLWTRAGKLAAQSRPTK